MASIDGASSIRDNIQLGNQKIDWRVKIFLLGGGKGVSEVGLKDKDWKAKNGWIFAQIDC